MCELRLTRWQIEQCPVDLWRELEQWPNQWYPDQQVVVYQVPAAFVTLFWLKYQPQMWD